MKTQFKHNNSFIYCSIKIELDEYKIHQLENGFLYIHKSAEYQERKDENGITELVLIGIKYNTSKDVLEISDIRNEGDVLEALNCWSGRFTLYAFNRFYNDPCGLKHVYYGKINDLVIITSSLSLLKQLFLIKSRKNSELFLINHPMNWIPAPITKYNEFNQLLPSSSVGTDLISIPREIFFNVENLCLLSIDDLRNRINSVCFYIIREICKDPRPKVLALTGGHDSRTVFAYLKEFYASFSTILLDHPKIHIWDMIVFRKLSKLYGVNNVFVKRKKSNFNLNMLNEFDTHCDYSCNEEDRNFYAHKQLNAPSETLMLRANVVSEIFRIKNYIKLNSNVDSFDALISELEKKYGKLDGFKCTALEEWYTMRIINDVKNRHIDWRILFWLDQRSSSWAGSIDEAAEVSDYQYINPFNSTILLNLFYVLSIKSSGSSDFQEDIIKSVDPDLLNIEFNKTDSSIMKNKRMREVIRFIIRKLI